MERLSNSNGYVMIGLETTPGVAVIPSIAVPIYDESMTTNLNLDSDNPIVYNKAARFQSLMGMRGHTGDMKFLGDPFTAAYVANMFLTKTLTSGSGPYTHVFEPSNTVDPKTYTMDILRGQTVFRFAGVGASRLANDYENNKMVLNTTLSALSSFSPRLITNVTSLTLTLDTGYDPNPTKGLVATDLVGVLKSDGSVLSTTVTSITATTVVVASATGVAIGDTIFLRAQTPTLNALISSPFMWARTEHRFGTTATVALSAAHTPLAEGSNWELMHPFEDDEGAKMSGSFDPAALPRLQVDGILNGKVYYDKPDEMARFLNVTKRGVVVRHFAGAANAYEMRVTFNNTKLQEDPVNLSTGEMVYAEPKFLPEYDITDGKMLSLTVINSTATI